MPKLNLPRDVLAKITQGNPRAIFALEQTLEAVGTTLPATIEEANALAGAALAAAEAALAMLAAFGEALEYLASAPATAPATDVDDTAPRVHLGSISTQDHDRVEITGGTIDGTPIGATTAAAGSFTTLSASGQVTSTVSIGTAPLVIASTTKVSNLYVDRAALADSATNATHATNADALTSPNTYPSAATDLPTCIALANALRSAAISKGL